MEEPSHGLTMKSLKHEGRGGGGGGGNGKEGGVADAR